MFILHYIIIIKLLCFCQRYQYGILGFMKLEIVTPEKTVFSDEIDQVSLPTPDGEITILPQHIPLVTQVKPGELTIKRNENFSHFVTGSGFVEITGQTVSILTDLAETSDNIDEKKIEEARNRAEEAMKQKQAMSGEEFARTAAELEKSLAQLKFKRKHHPKHPVSQNS